MKRVFSILLLLLAAVYPLRSQLTSINGELRYQHQFLDAYSEKSYSKLVRKNPQFTLGTAGYLYAPSILSFQLRSTLNLYYNDVTFGSVKNSFKQTVFNYYDLNVDALTNYIAQFSFSARDLEMRSTSMADRSTGSLSNYRQQEQRFTASSSNIKFLPTTVLGYSRIHNFSSTSPSTFDNRQDELSLMLSQAIADGSLSASAVMNNNRDEIAGVQRRYYRVQFNGSKEFSPKQRLDINSEYYKFESVSVLSGNGNYNFAVGDKFRFNSNIGGRNLFSTLSTSQLLSFGQTVQYFQNENFHYYLTLQNQTGSDIVSGGGTAQKTPNNQFNSSAALEHTRALGRFNMGNSLSASNSQFRSSVSQQSSALSLTNNLQTAVSRFNFSTNQGITYSRTTGYLSRDEVNNYINFIASGTLPYDINSQLSIDYRNERRLYTAEYYFNRKSLMINEIMNTYLYYYIPVSITLGGTVTWTWYNRFSRVYGINGTVSGNNLFLNGLNFSYRYNRTYDIFLKVPYQEQMLELNYQWRALSFQLRLQEFRFIDVRHEVWFIVSRPFNIGL